MLYLGLLHYSILDGNGTRERFMHFLDDVAHHVRTTKCETEDELFEAIHVASDKILPEHCNNMIVHTSSNVLKCIDGERYLI